MFGSYLSFYRYLLFYDKVQTEYDSECRTNYAWSYYDAF